MVLDGKSSQKYLLNIGVPQGSFVLIPHYKLLTSLMMLFVILLSMLMILLSAPIVIRNLIFDND